jgi:nucleoside 2-deoxyribosyltransferase
MKIYIAAMYGQRDYAFDVIARALTEAGHVVTARWLWEDEPPGSEQASAIKDLADVARADAVVLITNPIGTKYSGGGRHVEFGYALALDKLCIAVGEYETIFQYLPQVPVFSTIAEVVNYLNPKEAA